MNPWALSRLTTKAQAEKGQIPTCLTQGHRRSPSCTAASVPGMPYAQSLPLEFTKYFGLSSPLLYSFPPVSVPLFFVFTSRVCPPNQEALNRSRLQTGAFFSVSSSGIPNPERMLFTLLVLGRSSSPHPWLVTPTEHNTTLSLDLC